MIALVQFPLFSVPGVTVNRNIPLPEQFWLTTILPILAEPGYEAFMAGVHIPAPTTELSDPDVCKQHDIVILKTLLAVVLNDPSFALFLADPRLTSTMEARIPIIAITMRSSIRVNPSLFFLIVFILFFGAVFGNLQRKHNTN